MTDKRRDRRSIWRSSLSEALSDQLHCEILTDRLSAELLRDDYYLQPPPSGSQILGPAQTGPTGRHRKLPLIGRDARAVPHLHRTALCPRR